MKVRLLLQGYYIKYGRKGRKERKGKGLSQIGTKRGEEKGGRVEKLAENGALTKLFRKEVATEEGRKLGL